MNDYPDVCPHCNANLDGGDIYDEFLRHHNGDADKALESASAYGWSPERPLRFSRLSVRYDDRTDRPVAWVCSDCNGEWDV